MNRPPSGSGAECPQRTPTYKSRTVSDVCLSPGRRASSITTASQKGASIAPSSVGAAPQQRQQGVRRSYPQAAVAEGCQRTRRAAAATQGAAGQRRRAAADQPRPGRQHDRRRHMYQAVLPAMPAAGQNVDAARPSADARFGKRGHTTDDTARPAARATRAVEGQAGIRDVDVATPSTAPAPRHRSRLAPESGHAGSPASRTRPPPPVVDVPLHPSRYVTS